MNQDREEILARRFEPQGLEERWYDFWIQRGTFEADPDSGREPFCIVIPPPNVTGRLHTGHALVNTLQDVVIRWRRMQGRDTLWLPGTDHAGIATQMVVVRELAKQGIARQDLGREKFEEEVWKWKEEHGSAIVEQLKRLGASCDWSRTRFTLDEGLSRAVREVFVTLYEDGLIYRHEYIVNWCPRCDTALSDLEVEHKELTGKLWHIRYGLTDGSGSVVVATTRPETMLGDTGLAVSPEDERYEALLGRTATLPLVGRELPIFEDDFVDAGFGTGVVKVTPGHDPNDFDMGQRHGLEIVKVIDRAGTITDAAPEEFRGMERFEARKAVLARLEQEGVLEKTEDYVHKVGHCSRCSTVVEPQVSLQWFVKMKPLAEPAIEAVESGRTRFVPDHWRKTYLEWMTNIHDWCISRQLWWGHRIPAWYCDHCDEVTVGREDPTECSGCGGAGLRQDEDVLDTWFSSQLWPFSTMGWPERTKDLETYYPTNVLITGFDIIFFWVARMIMAGLRFMGEVPFHEVFIHGLVRDKDNKKMSKTAGNVIDPLVLMDQYGTDAVRFTMCAMCTPGNDFPLDYDLETKESPRLSGYRAFCNKLWNACRFLLMNVQSRTVGAPEPEEGDIAERWILSRLDAAVEGTLQALEGYRFDVATHTLYHFVWDELCDWYIELAKPYLPDEGERGERCRGVAVHVFDQVLRLLHPVMPYITEELWQKLEAGGECLAEAPYPATDAARRDSEAEATVELWQQVIQTARNLRVQVGIDPGRRVPLVLVAPDASARERLAAGSDAIAGLARCEPLEIVGKSADDGPSARGVLTGVEVVLPLEGVVDTEAERARHEKEIARLDKELQKISGKLSNESFLDKAPPEVVAKVQGQREELEEKKARIQTTLETLGG